jgi:hypothetical protein
MLTSTLLKKKRRSCCKEDNPSEEHLLSPIKWPMEKEKAMKKV